MLARQQGVQRARNTASSDVGAASLRHTGVATIACPKQLARQVRTAATQVSRMYFLGVDFGTPGARATAIDGEVV